MNLLSNETSANINLREKAILKDFAKVYSRIDALGKLHEH